MYGDLRIFSSETITGRALPSGFYKSERGIGCLLHLMLFVLIIANFICEPKAKAEYMHSGIFSVFDGGVSSS